MGYIRRRSYLANSCSRSRLVTSELTKYDLGSIKPQRVASHGLMLQNRSDIGKKVLSGPRDPRFGDEVAISGRIPCFVGVVVVSLLGGGGSTSRFDVKASACRALA